MKLQHVALVCGSEESADRFYRGVLGLMRIKSAVLNKDLAKKIFDTAVESQLILFGNESFAVEVFVPASVAKDKPPYSHVCLEVADRDEFLRKCEAAGLSVSRIPRGDTLLVFMEDFDGNLFEIKEIED